jgi:hypothetical protein
MLLNENFGERLEGLSGRDNLNKDLGTVNVGIDHRLNGADLTGYLAQTVPQRFFLAMAVLVVVQIGHLNHLPQNHPNSTCEFDLIE